MKNSAQSNFCLEDLDMFSDFFFKDTLELYDWIKGGGPADVDLQVGKSQKFFYFLPRFERKTTENLQASNNIEVLGMDHVMAHFLSQDTPLIDSKNLANLLKCPEAEWEKYIDRFRGQLVTNPGKKPSTIRLDQLDREQTFTGKTNQNDRYPTIVHFGVRPANLRKRCEYFIFRKFILQNLDLFQKFSWKFFRGLSSYKKLVEFLLKNFT